MMGRSKAWFCIGVVALATAVVAPAQVAAQKPTKIVFCPSSCQALKTDFGVKVQILLGCKTEVAK